MFSKKFFSLIMSLLAVSLLSSCATTQSSSETTGNTSEATSDLTSSTSLRDDEESEETEVLKFIESNYSHIRSDMSMGKGEYLTTLATLLSIEDAKKEQFYALTKSSFNQIFDSSDTNAQDLLSNLLAEMSKANI